MSITTIMKQFSAKLFGRAPKTHSVASVDDAALNAIVAQTIERYIISQHHAVVGLRVKYLSQSMTIMVGGIASDAVSRANIARCCKKIIGVAKVKNMLTIAAPRSYDAGRSVIRLNDTLSNTGSRPAAATSQV